MKALNWLVREPVVVGVILLNAVAVFAMGFRTHPVHERFWFWVDFACVVFFVVEAAIKIARDGLRRYLSVTWNRFDITIVFLSLPVLADPFVDLHALIALPVLRLGRLFRLFRLLRFIPDRARIAAGVARALRASVGVILAVMLINFILAIGACLLFRDFVPAHFGDPLTSCYSMFQVFTVEGWHEIPRAIATAADSQGWAVFARIYFVGAVSVGGILGLSLANAVFVDQMTADNTEPLQAKVDRLTQEIHALRSEIRALHGSPTERA